MLKAFPLGRFSKYILLIVIALASAAPFCNAQKILSADRRKLKEKEDSLQHLAADIILDSLTAGRMRSDSFFVKTLIRALQIKNSFYYPFDSVQGVSKLYAPDSAFRIFTWNISFDDYYSRQRGAIQMKTPDGSLKLFPLRDFSEFTTGAMDSIRTKANWIGAVYYDIAKTTYNGKNYYTMIGFDNNGVMSNKKWIEVMTFGDRGEPVFGGQYFSFEKDSVKRAPQYRFSLEYKKEARAILKYDDESKLIIVDHLISETDEPQNKWTYVPDGDYEAFKWQNGKWVHIDKLFNYKLEEGQAPVGDPLLDMQGKPNEKKLEEKSQKNRSKKNGNDLN
ncbi:MAG: hypothetical protein E6H06_04205 [Bacteroidetes bacterium]|nr:MAG: hypothetical protein E6H06_04205 [Bacteroidota bacterium]